MPAARPRPKVIVRGWTQGETAYYLGVSENFLSENLEAYLREGFPQPSPLSGKYDIVAVARWYNRHSGLEAKAEVDPFLAAAEQLEDELAGVADPRH